AIAARNARRPLRPCRAAAAGFGVLVRAAKVAAA
nr:hypothetical protein [Tanacetum cinerariifolium]